MGLLPGVVVGAILCASFVPASYLVNLLPWWTADSPRTVLVTGVLGLTAAIGALVTVLTRGRHPLAPVGALAALTAITLGLDVLTGSRLQMNAVFGSFPLEGSRFTGLGNMASGLFQVSALLACGVGLAILTVAITVTCLVVAYSASTWRTALAESRAVVPAADDSADGLARSGGA